MTLEQEITKYLEDAGALKVGFTNQEILKDGPPSTVLSTYMTEAKSAILFAIPMDRELIRSYLAKDNINARSDLKNSGIFDKVLKVGESAPEFFLPDENGNLVTLLQRRAGRLVVVDGATGYFA